MFSGSANLSAIKFDEHITVDYTRLLPHEGKEVSVWSHRHLRRRKWIVFLDCDTKQIKKKLID